ncbi:hypothetical protein [Bacillus sp. Brlt_9]|uniref:hypothetical protein n=1 Tax=Bacillus sp. Brlt_9 TaxID=3110916 RepID=UPI003F7C0E6A
MINVPKEVKEGQMVVNLDYSRCDLGVPYMVDKVFAEEYNPLHSYHPYGQPSIRLVEPLEKHIGEVVVRYSTKEAFVVKVRIKEFECRTEANLVITKEDAEKIGITSLDIAKQMMPKMKGFVLAQIHKQYPHYWDLNY